MKLKKDGKEKEAAGAFEIAQLKAIGYVPVAEEVEAVKPAKKTKINADIAAQLAKKEEEEQKDDPNSGGSPGSQS